MTDVDPLDADDPERVERRGTPMADELGQELRRLGAVERDPVQRWAPNPHKPAAELVDPAELTVAMDQPLAVTSGYTHVCELLVSNPQPVQVTVRGGVHLVGDVHDPDTGRQVGGYGGGMYAMGKAWTIGPGASVSIPVMVGTDSVDPRLGDTVPPGTWALTVAFELTIGPRHPQRPGRNLVTPAFLLHIT